MPVHSRWPGEPTSIVGSTSISASLERVYTLAVDLGCSKQKDFNKSAQQLIGPPAPPTPRHKRSGLRHTSKLPFVNQFEHIQSFHAEGKIRRTTATVADSETTEKSSCGRPDECNSSFWLIALCIFPKSNSLHIFMQINKNVPSSCVVLPCITVVVAVTLPNGSNVLRNYKYVPYAMGEQLISCLWVQRLLGQNTNFVLR